MFFFLAFFGGGGGVPGGGVWDVDDVFVVDDGF
jgi:hypothetical protein